MKVFNPSQKRILLILTAGTRNQAYWHGWKMPFFFFFLTWPIFKWLAVKIGFELRPTGRLKTETLARLEKALKLWGTGTFQKILVTGGYNPDPVLSSTVLMKAWLVERGVHESLILAESHSVDTSGNIANSIAALLKYYDKDADLRIVIDTSWYHTGRAIKHVRQIIMEQNLDWDVTGVRVWPPLTWECLAYEYAYNLFTEVFKRLFECFPWLVKKYQTREKDHRDRKR